jgi:hypothetical protein
MDGDEVICCISVQSLGIYFKFGVLKCAATKNIVNAIVSDLSLLLLSVGVARLSRAVFSLPESVFSDFRKKLDHGLLFQLSWLMFIAVFNLSLVRQFTKGKRGKL